MRSEVNYGRATTTVQAGSSIGTEGWIFSWTPPDITRPLEVALITGSLLP